MKRKTAMRKAYLLALGLSLVLMGCGPVISPAITRQIVSPPTFAALRTDTEAYLGQTVLLGGEVVSVTVQNGGSLLEVDQRELDATLRPVDVPVSGGSFFVESEEWLSPRSYVPRRKVTVAGEVKGRYRGAPLLKAKEIHLGDYPRWEKWYYPVPREWYHHDPALEHWFTPPYFDPWRQWGR
jgi:starvation-inducible outer membrane lipoprotein